MSTHVDALDRVVGARVANDGGLAGLGDDGSGHCNEMGSGEVEEERRQVGVERGAQCGACGASRQRQPALWQPLTRRPGCSISGSQTRAPIQLVQRPRIVETVEIAVREARGVRWSRLDTDSALPHDERV